MAGNAQPQTARAGAEVQHPGRCMPASISAAASPPPRVSPGAEHAGADCQLKVKKPSCRRDIAAAPAQRGGSASASSRAACSAVRDRRQGARPGRSPAGKAPPRQIRVGQPAAAVVLHRPLRGSMLRLPSAFLRVLGQNRRDGGNGHLDHSVVRFKDGQALHPDARAAG